jgi:Family of unknown function (DUF6056)
MTSVTRSLAVWAAIVVPIWITLALCVHWEPVVHDGWGHVHWHRTNAVTLANVWAFAKGTYLHNNPRLGQVITLLLFTPGPWNTIITPIVELALFVQLAALVLGRWPSPRRTDDAVLFLSIIAIGITACPVVGPMLFYRPYTGNYLYALVVILSFAMPYRFHAESPRRRGWWTAPIMLALGVLAGMCNENTGVAIAAAVVVALVAFVRRGERLAPWMIAGLVGVVIGSAVLLLAPGHAFRYNGIASQHNALGWIAERGVVGNLHILSRLLVHLLAVVPWVIAALIVREPRVEVSRARVISSWVLIGTAVLAMLALYASPLIGERLYLASTMLACAAIAGWVHTRIAARRWCVGLSAIALAFFAWRSIAAYRVLGPAGADRLEVLDHVAPDSNVVLEPFGVRGSHWNVGDDMLDPARRELLAHDYGVASVTLASDGPAN